MPPRSSIDGQAPYRDSAAAAHARLAALGEEIRCAECTRVRVRTTANVRDFRAVAGSFGIVLGLLLVELLLVSLAHGAFGRFENSAVLIQVLVAGAFICGTLCWIAWAGRSPIPPSDEDARVLVTLSNGSEVHCPRPHAVDFVACVKRFASERRARGAR